MPSVSRAILPLYIMHYGDPALAYMSAQPESAVDPFRPMYRTITFPSSGLVARKATFIEITRLDLPPRSLYPPRYQNLTHSSLSRVLSFKMSFARQSLKSAIKATASATAAKRSYTLLAREAPKVARQAVSRVGVSALGREMG
jgi:hypothetical protein